MSHYEIPEHVVRPTLHECDLIQEWNSAIEAAAREADALKEEAILRTRNNPITQYDFERAACFRDCAARIRALKKN